LINHWEYLINYVEYVINRGEHWLILRYRYVRGQEGG